MLKKSFLLLFVLSLFFTGCNANEIPVTPTVMNSLPVTVVLTSLTSTPVPPTAIESANTTFTPNEVRAYTLTPKLTPTETLFTECQQIVDEQMPQGFLAEGSIIFKGECDGRSGLYKLSSETLKIEPFLENEVNIQYMGNADLAPNQEWMVFDNTNYGDSGIFIRSEIVVTTADENNFVIYPIDRNWFGVTKWTDSFHFLAPVYRAPEHTTSVINPFSGAYYRIYTPGKFEGFDDRYKFLSLNPSFDRVIFTRDEYTVVLEDLLTGQELWSAPEYHAYDFINWSPNGNHFAHIQYTETGENFSIVIVDRDGFTTPIDLEFNLQYPYNEVHSQWSLDNRYLVLWEFISEGLSRLVMVNVVTQSAQDFGIITNGLGSFPFFSPDGNQFVVNYSDGKNDIKESTHTLFVSIEKTQQVDLFWNLTAIGWLKNTASQVFPSVERRPFPQAPASEASLVQQKCLLVEESHENFSFNNQGGIVFYKNDILYKLSPDGKEEMISELIRNANPVVSPNRRWLAYNIGEFGSSQNPERVFLTSLDDQQVQEFDNKEYGRFITWLDNESWLTHKFEANYFFVKPFLNQWEEIGGQVFESYRERYPDTYFTICEYGCVRGVWYAPAIYNSDLDRAIYLHGPLFDYENPGLALLDISNNKDLWEYQNWEVAFNEPKWNFNESSFAIPLPTDSLGEHYEIFIIDRAGNQTQATNFQKAYPVTVIDGLEWSSDGKQIAFWMDTRGKTQTIQHHPFRLFVLNVETRLVTDYCVYGTYQYNRDIVWSPDGSQIAVNSIHETGDNQIILIDPIAEYAVHLLDGWLVGWMVAP